MLSDEEKKAIKELTEIKELFEEDLKEDYEVTAILDQIDLESLVIALNLIKKQSKEIEEVKAKNKILEAISLSFNEIQDRDKKWEDKIKAKIEELEKQDRKNRMSHNYLVIPVLQSLLEKE